MKLTLPWPDTQLWPNRPHHWTAKHRRRKAAKEDAWTACLTAGVRNLDAERLRLSLTFHGPTRRSFDLDNALAAMKGAIDGIALATGIDDSRFEIAIARGEAAPPYGRVIVEVTPLRERQETGAAR